MTKKTLKKLLLLLLCGALCLPTLLACGDKTETPVTTEEPQKETEPEPTANTEWIIIRSVSGGEKAKALSLAVRDLLRNLTQAEVSLKTDDYVDVEPQKDRKYLLIGNTSMALSKKVKGETASGEASFLFEENCLAIYASEDNLLWIGVQNFFSTYYSREDGLRMPKEGKLMKLDLSAEMRTGWALPCPSYDGGKFNQKLYSTGYGAEETNSPSTMHVITDTNAGEFQLYLAKMEELGYKQTFTNTIDGNLYAAFQDSIGTNLYAYYTTSNSKSGSARVIWDRSSTATLEEFNYTTEVSGQAEFYMFNMNSEAEDTLLIRLADGAWIVIDGGVTGWKTTDPDRKFADALFNFMSSKSQLQSGEKLVIAAWHLTHAHRDHCLAFGALIEKYHDRIDLQRILANVPDHSTIATDQISNYPQYKEVMTQVNLHFPNAMYLKAHAGMEIQLADVSFTVLQTADDMADYWADNKDIYVGTWKFSWDSGDKSTYRTEYKVYDFNNSSMLTMINVAGLKVLSLGDGFRADQTMIPYFSTETLTPHILKVSHHFFNDELIPFYYSISAQKKPLYVLVTHTSYSKTSAKNNWLESLKSEHGQFFTSASADYVFGYQLVNGQIVQKKYPATYSFLNQSK